MQRSGVEQRQWAVLGADQQADLGTAQHHRLGASVCQARNHFAKCLP